MLGALAYHGSTCYRGSSQARFARHKYGHSCGTFLSQDTKERRRCGQAGSLLVCRTWLIITKGKAKSTTWQLGLVCNYLRGGDRSIFAAQM
eukprot:7522723-Pyramimonas_sp.AAC.1